MCGPCGVGGTPWQLAAFLGKVGADDKPAVTAWLRECGLLNGKREIVAVYDYRDERGNLLFQVVRYEPKDFRPRRPNSSGGWIWNVVGVRRVLYNLPEVLKSKSVLICQGEEDSGTAGRLGLVATCNVGGPGKWELEYAEYLRSKRAVIIAHADAAGWAHAKQVARSLVGVAESVRLIEALPAAKDLSEWVERGGVRERLLEIIKRTPELTPEVIAEWGEPPKAESRLGCVPRVNPWDAACDIASFLAERDSEVEFFEQRVLAREAVTEVFSPRGIGKSEWATDLAIRQAKAGRRVLYLDRDNPPRITRERFRAWGAEGVMGLKVLTRDKIPPLTRADSWALFPWADYDVVVVDSLDSHAEGVGEQDSAKPSRAIAPLLDIAHRDGGPAVLILGNCIKTGQHSRGSGVVEDRGDFVFEVRDITGWIPTGKKSWWEELPPADAGSWASRASRRKQRKKIRLAFVCTKFRGLDEPEPFAFEIDFSSDPRSCLEVTNEIDVGGAEAREAHRRERGEKLDRAAKLLVEEITRRQKAGEPVLPKDRGAVPFLVNSGLGRNQARELLNAREGLDWTFQPIEGERGKPLGVFLPSESGEGSSGIYPISGANPTPLEDLKTAGAEDPYLRHQHEQGPAQICPDQTGTNSGDGSSSELRHSPDSSSPDDVSDSEIWGEL
jgi:hypothetical protein